jgi:hypothetical protein
MKLFKPKSGVHHVAIVGTQSLATSHGFVSPQIHKTRPKTKIQTTSKMILFIQLSPFEIPACAGMTAGSFHIVHHPS